MFARDSRGAPCVESLAGSFRRRAPKIGATCESETTIRTSLSVPQNVGGGVPANDYRLAFRLRFAAELREARDPRIESAAMNFAMIGIRTMGRTLIHNA